MTLLWVLSIATPLLLALLAAGIVAGVGGAAAASQMRRGPMGANLAGLCSLAGAALVALPLLLSETDSGLDNTQVLLFGLALGAISAMGGQISGNR